MLDVGWPIEAMKGIPLVARAAGLVAHLFEESSRSIGFIMSHQADLAIGYDGPVVSRRSE
jgi:citrate synthase